VPLLVPGKELMRREKDWLMVRHVDLSIISTLGWNEIVVDGRGNIYVNSINFEFLAGEQPKSGVIALVTPDGKARKVAGDLSLPNGMVVTPDNSTLIISESFAERLLAFDIATLGSPDGQTLFLLATKFRGSDKVKEMAEARVGEVLISKVTVPGAGKP